MAQFVKLEPGDVLVLANLGAAELYDGDQGPHGALMWVKEQCQLGGILVFEGDVDLSVLPAGWTPDAVAGS